MNETRRLCRADRLHPATYAADPAHPPRMGAALLGGAQRNFPTGFRLSYYHCADCYCRQLAAALYQQLEVLGSLRVAAVPAEDFHSVAKPRNSGDGEGDFR